MNNDVPVPWLSQVLSGDWLNIAGGWASIAGFIVSLFVLWDVRRIRNAYLFKARAPELIAQLGTQASVLSQYLNDFAGSQHGIQVVLAETSVTLKYLERKLPGDAKEL